MKKSMCALAILSLLLMGCGDDSPSGPSSGGEDAAYYPLAVGNLWIYDREGQMTVSGVTTTTIDGRNVTEITGTVTHQSGFELYEQETAISDTFTTAGQSITIDSTFTTYMRITDEGFYTYVDLFGSDSMSVVPFPLQVGATWQLSQDPPITAEILSLTETVTVPAGTFSNCLQLKTTWIESGNTVENVSVFAPNVGRVRNEYTQSYEMLVTSVISELQSYSVN